MTKSTFERKHPTVKLQVLYQGKRVLASASWQFGGFCFLSGTDEKSALDTLSRRVYSLQSREVAEEQGHRDANTGQVAPLQTHHKIKRSAGGDHSKGNLAGVSAETHDFQHHRKK
jgi:hypothetical protein